MALGFLLGAVISAAAFALRALSRSGALAATIIGGLTFGAGGTLPGALLLIFFVSSSALSKIASRRKAAASRGFEKGSRRDAGQVLANGGLAAGLSVAYGAGAGIEALAALAGALAAVTADTWATEVGVLAGERPWRLTDGRRVQPGTSGAVSRQGSLAAVAGAGLLAVVAGAAARSAALVGAVWVGGIVGALLDSLLGASVQAMFYCPVCDKETERHPRHHCGSATRPLRGWRWLRNDAVNLAASAAGALAALGAWAAWLPG